MFNEDVHTSSATTVSIPKYLDGGGEAGELIRSIDWSRTSIGPIAGWPVNLCITLNIMLNTRSPMFLFWGPDLVCFYNDAYRPSLGNNGKHPSAMGSKGKDVWPEIWADIKPLIDQVMEKKEATWSEDQLLPIYRNGKLEDVYWTFSYSPIVNDAGDAVAVLVTCSETTEKVKSLAKLKESEQRFRNLVSQAPVGVIVLKGEELIVDIVNEFYCQVIHKEYNEVINRPIFEVIPETEAGFKKIIDEVRVTGNEVYLYDHPYFVYKNGEEKAGYLNLVYQPYKEMDGAVTGVIVLVNDVTALVHARKLAEESSELLEIKVQEAIKKLEQYKLDQQAYNLFLQAPVPIAIYKGTELIVELANEASLALVKKSKAVLGKPLLQVLPEIEGQGFVKLLHSVMRTGQPYYASEAPTILNPEGEEKLFYFNFVYQPYYESDGSITGVLSLASDVTDQVVARKKIEYAEERARLAVESAELGVYEIIYDSNDMITSSRFNQIWGFDAPAHRTDYSSVIVPEDLRIRKKAHEESLVTGHLEYEARIIVKDSIRWVRVKGKVLFDDKGKPSRLLGVAQDINDQKLFAEELAKQVDDRTRQLSAANSELQKLNAELEQFAYAASHDMQEPLRKVQNFSSLLLQHNQQQLDERGRNYLNKIGNSVSRMKTIIDDLLQYSHQTRENQQLVSTDLNTILQNIEADLELIILEKNATIIKDTLPVIQAIPAQINQLFYNLITNALKFSKPQVPVQVTVSAKMLSPEEVSKINKLSKQHLYVHITFADNGIGFEQEYSQRIFGLFTRLHGRSEYEGTGIGLALCEKIVKNHGGEIYAISKPFEGASFHVILPVE